MPLHIPAEAICDNCGKTTPCKLDCASVSIHNRGELRYDAVGVAIRGLTTWFWSFDGLACSKACRDTLAQQPRFAEYSDKWMACR